MLDCVLLLGGIVEFVYLFLYIAHKMCACVHVRMWAVVVDGEGGISV